MLDPDWLARAVQREREEAARRRRFYLAARESTPVEGQTAILIDDGIATGLTMRAAIQEVRARHPQRIVLAVPVIAEETAVVFQREVDEVVAVERPAIFLGAVGAYYDQFLQVTDEEVIRLLG
jgi:predicted phosphoribosyltransferase